MGTEISDKFLKMGARARITLLPKFDMIRRWSGNRQGMRDRRQPITVDIRNDRNGEYFDIRHRSDVEVQIVDIRPADRHLLLMTREPSDERRGEVIKSKFLCGHDERSWFVAAVPEDAIARNVQDAMDALKPTAVWDAIQQHGVAGKDRNRRRTAAFVRQGEWFFIPRPKLQVNETLILLNEPIRRGGGKPHRCEMLYRIGGTMVHVHSRYPNGLTTEKFYALDPRESSLPGWRMMARDPRAFVKGTVRHPDHATIRLDFWHEVVMNTETRARAMRHVAFLD